MRHVTGNRRRLVRMRLCPKASLRISGVQEALNFISQQQHDDINQL